MKTIVLDGQTYELRPIEDKKDDFAVSWVNQMITIVMKKRPTIDQMIAMYDAVEALMEYIYSSTEWQSYPSNFIGVADKAKELLEK